MNPSTLSWVLVFFSGISTRPWECVIIVFYVSLLRKCLDVTKERVSQMAEVQATRAFERSPLRTRDPEVARLFFVPLWEWTSLRAGRCANTTHKDRIRRFADALHKSVWFKRNGGRDHLWVSSASRATIYEANGDYTLNRGRQNRLRDAWPLLKDMTAGLRKPEEFRRVYEVPYGTPPSFATSNDKRARAVYFAGSFDVCCTGYVIRCKLANMRTNASWLVLKRIGGVFHYAKGQAVSTKCGAHIPEISIKNAILDMRTNVFCFVPPGDNYVSARLYTAISQGCIPIIVSDKLHGAFHAWIPYEKFTFRIPQNNFSLDSLRFIVQSTPLQSIRAMQSVIKRVQDNVLWSGQYVARHAMRAAIDVSAAAESRGLRAMVYTTTQNIRYKTAFDSAHIPITMGGRHPFRGGDRELWLLDQLPIGHEHVLHTDGSDVLPICDAMRFEQTMDRLRASSSRRPALIVGGEKNVWPRTVDTTTYPHSNKGPIVFANIGVLAGSSNAYFDVLNCMRLLYEGFPRYCPELRRDGIHSVPSTITAKRFADQSCYHTYIQESAAGQLPTMCPTLLVDNRAELILNLPKVSQRFRDEDVVFRETNTTPCVLHAPGSSKWRVKELDKINSVSRMAMCRARYRHSMQTVPKSSKERREYFKFHDLKNCTAHATHILHGCPHLWCERMPKKTINTRYKLCISMSDDRTSHPGINMWRIYCVYHGYSFYLNRPTPTNSKKKGERIMRADCLTRVRLTLLRLCHLCRGRSVAGPTFATIGTLY